jgi:hypothetical protein
VKSESTRAIFLAGAALGLACLAAGGSRRRSEAAAVEAAEAAVVEPQALAPVAVEPPAPRRRLRRRWTLLAVAVVGALVAGAAIAAWSVSGSGSGYAKATTATLLTVGDASASTSADLYPGGTGAVKLMVTNPNGFAVRITSVSGTGTITSDKGAACNASTGVTFTNQSGLTLDLAGGATSTFTLAGAVAMSNSSDNSCQGALFTIPVSVTGVSN